MLDPFHCYNETQRVLKDNLRMLNTSYLDLVLVHYPPVTAFVARSCGGLTCAMARAQWRALEEFYAANLTRAVGVSNYCPSCFECLQNATVAPMVNQLLYHVGMGQDPKSYVSYCQQHGCVVSVRLAWQQAPRSA